MSPNEFPANRTLPDYRLLVLQQRGADLERSFDFPLEIIGADRYSSPLLYLPPSTRQIQIVVTSATYDKIWLDETVIVSEQPFHVHFRYLPKAVEHPLMLLPDEGGVRPGRNERFDTEKVVSINKTRRSEVIFMIDVSMPVSALAQIEAFITQLVERLKTDSQLTYLAAMWFGEHEKHGIQAGMLTEFTPFSEWGSVMLERLRRIQAQPPAFANKGYCGALELALAQVANNTDSLWADGGDARHVLLITQSPPHPAPDERERFRLLDFTADEFDGIDWKIAVDVLVEQGVRLHLAWVNPPQTGGIADFIRMIDEKITGAPDLLAFDPVELQADLRDLLREANDLPFQFSSPVRLPLIAPLYDPYPLNIRKRR